MNQSWTCEFYLDNNGNRDVEPIELSLWFPSAILSSDFRPVADVAIFEVKIESRGDVAYTPSAVTQKRPMVVTSKPANENVGQDIDFDVGNILRRCEQCLERRKEKSNNCARPARLGIAKD